MPVRSGDDLQRDIDTLEVSHHPLVEGLLYQRHVTFIAGEPGGGKSIIATQLALALSSGSMVFGSLAVPQPRRVYYLQLEGSYPDTIDRIRRMRTKVPVNTTNLAWDFRTGLDLLSPLQGQEMIMDISTWGNPELLIVDPLYQSVFGELSAELPTKALIKFLDVARAHFDPCAILLIHHTRKASYASDGRKIKEDDPFYGSQWLKAYVDESYVLSSGDGPYKDHVFLTNKKDRYSVGVKELLLHYDPETDTVSTDAPLAEQSPYERVIKYLALCHREQRTTHFFEVAKETSISFRHLRRLVPVLCSKGLLVANRREGHRKIWEAQANCAKGAK